MSRAFEELKRYLNNLLLLTSSLQGEILHLYLAVAPEVLSSVLIREEGRIQKLVYFLIKILVDGEKNYDHIEKLAFAVICKKATLLFSSTSDNRPL